MTNPMPTTLRTRAGLPTRPSPLAESAIVVIDAQVEYGPDGALSLPGFAAALDKIGSLLAAARTRGAPIVHVAHCGPTGGLFDRADGGRFAEQATPLPGEVVVEKTLPNSFAATDLAKTLESIGVGDLVLVGFMTHMCVSSTARAGLDLGFTSTVVHDATATRALPLFGDRDPIEAEHLHDAALAALADRFSVVASTQQLLTSGGSVAGRSTVPRCAMTNAV